MSHRGSSRRRYAEFVQKYKRHQLDDPAVSKDARAESGRPEPGKRREYLRDYLRWLWPHRYAIGTVFALALLSAGLEMIAAQGGIFGWVSSAAAALAAMDETPPATS